MKSDEDRGHETAPLSRASGELVGRAASLRPTVVLDIYHRHGAEVVSLEPGRSVVIGREPPADVVVADPSLSRSHARFLLQRGALIVEDLGSTNGTRVRGVSVDRAVLRAGEPVLLGAVVVSAHIHSPLDPDAHALESHESFRAALEREIASARYFGDRFALILVRAEAEDAHVSRWHPSVRASLRPVDVLGLYGDRALELLLPRVSVAEAADRAATLVRAALKKGTALRCGVAGYPESASSAERVMEMCLGAALSSTPKESVRVAVSDRTSVLSSGLGDPSSDDPVTASPAMRELLDTIPRIARSQLPVLLYGETGAGKEVIARLLHLKSSRAGRPLVCVNCAAIPSDLVESTLFGHERGAFTGADRASVGIFGSADGGTVLLDEIGELPPDAQAALLRVLESGCMSRVGSPREIAVDVRVLAATHRDLDGMCEEGRFRRDLLYRLNAVTLVVPPLRERTEDVAPLARRFLEAAARSTDRRFQGISAAAMLLLEAYRWPGNVRELRNVIERATVIARGDVIEVEDLPSRLAQPGAASAAKERSDDVDEPETDGLDLKERLRRFEIAVIVRALRETGGNQTHGARRLGVPLRTLTHRMKLLGVKKSDYADSGGKTNQS